MAHCAEATLKTEQRPASGRGVSAPQSDRAVEWNFHPELLQSIPGSATISSDVAGSGWFPLVGSRARVASRNQDPTRRTCPRLLALVVLHVHWLGRIPGASCGFFVTCSTMRP
jgi:hypothetical protein